MSGSAVAELRHRLTNTPPLSPSHAGNSVAVAHAALEQLREEGDPSFLFLRVLLEEAPKITDEELVFHCILGIRQVILFQWSQLSRPYITAVAKITMFLGHHTLRNHRVLRLAAYTTSAAIWKRQWLDQSSGDGAPSAQEYSLVQQMNSMMDLSPNNSIDTPQLLLDFLLLHPQPDLESHALYLTAMVAEFGGRSAVSYRMPVEFHQEMHRTFEKQRPLQRILDWTIQKLRLSLGQPHHDIASAESLLTLAIDCIEWEFGVSAFHLGNYGASSTTKTLLRPPVEWRSALLQNDLVLTLCRAHEQHASLAPSIRQLLLVISSLSGPIFHGNEERSHFSAQLLQMTSSLLQVCTTKPDSRELIDTLQIFSRIVSNYRLALLSTIPQLLPMLQGLTSIGNQILHEQLQECKQSEGDIEVMEHREWREEVLLLVLDCAVTLSTDPWLLFSGTQESRKQAQHHLASVLGPLYEGFVQCRTSMAAMEEHYLVKNESELDEVKEEILAIDLEEELSSVSAVGRLNLSVAINCLSNAFSKVMPKLQSLWEGAGEVTPETAASLEEARLLTMYICHLLTDENESESPVIPDAVLVACQDNPGLSHEISGAVQALTNFSNMQAQKIAENPNNRRLSPILAKSFLWFLNRWGPSYICPADYRHENSSNSIVMEWSSEEKAQGAVNYCVSLCLHYQCYWPLEKHVHESAAKLLLSLSKRGGRVRQSMVKSPCFHKMVLYHCLTANQRHSAQLDEFVANVRPRLGDDSSSLTMVKGFHRLPYTDRSDILTAILVATSDQRDETAVSMFNESLKATHDAFTSLMTAISSGHIGVDDIHAQEMACLCVELFRGVAHAGEMAGSERIPQFVTGYLSHLSIMMKYYAKDLTICETLLLFFRDYTEQFIAVLDKEQSLALFHATADLLCHYSSNHCASRVIVKKTTAEAEADEEQAYSDISCAIQLLINLGTKDFIDACSEQNGVESSQVTDMIFFGLQQILPLMTQGLLQFPTLCSLFFELVGFMMETYPDKVCVLPYDLFAALLESLLFGMKHHDLAVAKCSLQGLTSMAREHLKAGVLVGHLQHRPDIFEKCYRRMFTEVVFQKVVTDRVEEVGQALLPMVAINMAQFAHCVNELCQQISDPLQRERLRAAFERLIRPDMMAKVVETGYEGRRVRLDFRDLFQDFVNDVHAFLSII